MDNIVSHILEIDKRAKDKLESAQMKKDEILSEALTEEEKIQSEIISRADSRLEEVERLEKLSADEKISEIEKAAGEQKSRLDEVFEEKHSFWAEQIVNAILAQAES